MVKSTTDSGRVLVGMQRKLLRLIISGVLPFWCSTIAAPVAAELGGSHATLEADRAHLAASMNSTGDATHVMHTLTTTNGSVVREYTNSEGVVFAVAWHGPGRPDLRQLLGESFDAFQTKVTAPETDAALPGNSPVVHHGRLRRALTVEQSNLVVHSAGHPGAFWGFAYLPNQVPAGFTPDALR